MAKLAILADTRRTVYSGEVTRQLHVMAQARESSPVIAVLTTVLHNLRIQNQIAESTAV